MNYGLLMVGVITAGFGFGFFIRMTADRKGIPLTGTVIANVEFRGRYLTKEYSPKIQYENPVTGQLDVITPLESKKSKWEIGSSVDLVFIESRGRARLDFTDSREVSLIFSGVGVGLLLLAFIW